MVKGERRGMTTTFDMEKLPSEIAHKNFVTVTCWFVPAAPQNVRVGQAHAEQAHEELLVPVLGLESVLKIVSPTQLIHAVNPPPCTGCTRG